MDSDKQIKKFADPFQIHDYIFFFRLQVSQLLASVEFVLS
jgi:hypothetical protein